MIVDYALDSDGLLKVFLIRKLALHTMTFRGTPAAFEALKTAGVTVEWDRHTFLDERPFGEDDSLVHVYVHSGENFSGLLLKLVLSHK